MIESAECPTEQQIYLSCPLRLWREGDGERPQWRASLRSAHTGEQVGLASLEDLYQYLHRQTGVAPNADEDEQS